MPEPRSELLRQLLRQAYYVSSEETQDPMPQDDTRDPNSRDEWVYRGKELQDLMEHMRTLRAVLPFTAPSISTAAQHITNLTDAVQTILLYLTGERPEL